MGQKLQIGIVGAFTFPDMTKFIWQVQRAIRAFRNALCIDGNTVIQLVLTDTTLQPASEGQVVLTVLSNLNMIELK